MKCHKIICKALYEVKVYNIMYDNKTKLAMILAILVEFLVRSHQIGQLLENPYKIRQVVKCTYKRVLVNENIAT